VSDGYQVTSNLGVCIFTQTESISILENYEPVGIGMPPKTRINSTIIIIPAIINGISKRKIAKTAIAISAIINKLRDDP
jgi:hypothetical protein